MNGGEMSETKDPAIKLFGKMIPFPVSQIPAKADEKSDEGCQIPEKSEVMDMCSEISKTEAEDVHSEESRMPDKFSVIKNGKEEDHQMLNLKPKEDSSTDQEKVLKKPDKVLPCPRCNSSETKFCYFNNYNVNQPRHFCKNCQRYWTAGGTMRNVPVGAGRRKNKLLASQFHQVLVPPDGVPITTCGESPTSSRPSTGNGTFAESTATVMKCTEIASEGENREDRSSCSTSMTVSSVWENENVLQKEQGGSPGSCNELTQPLQCYPVPPWVFAWNPGWNNAASMPDSVNPNPIQWCSMPVVAVPGLCAPNIPLQFVPVWAAGTKNMPFSCSGNNPGTLGKHARDGNLMDEENSEKCVLVPKTLRIDDQDEASKSSIWTTLGFKSDQKETESRCGIFKPFISITEDNVHPSDAAQVLEANPAALSRSQTFREST